MYHVALFITHLWPWLAALAFAVGATITPTLAINPTTMTNNWGTGVAANAQKWLNKYLNPRIAFNANPAQSQQAWQVGVTAALARNAYSNAMGKVSLSAAAAAASTYGLQNYSASGTQKKAKYAAKAPALAAAMTALRTQIEAMPNVTSADRTARMIAWKSGMEALAGTF